MRRVPAALAASILTCALVAAPTAACGGLIGPNGAVNLLRTTTFVGYHDGIEHYVTAFAFAGGGGAFGSITPLPGIPTDVEKGGDWTLQRLIRETDPPAAAAAVRGRPARRGQWRGGAHGGHHRRAGHHRAQGWRRRGRRVGRGPRLPAAARRPRGARLLRPAEPHLPGRQLRRRRRAGARTGHRRRHPRPHHHPHRRTRGCRCASCPWASRPTSAWTPTCTCSPTARPTLLPAATGDGLVLDHTAPASASLLDDLRSDRGMEWIPESAWLMKVRVDSRAADLRYDLAVDATGRGLASRVAAGLDMPAGRATAAHQGSLWLLGLGLVLASAAGVGALSRRGRPSGSPDA